MFELWYDELRWISNLPFDEILLTCKYADITAWKNWNNFPY